MSKLPKTYHAALQREADFHGEKAVRNVYESEASGSEATNEGAATHAEMSSSGAHSRIEKLIIRATAGEMISKIKELRDENDDEDNEHDEKTWCQLVLDHFNDIWDDLESQSIWNRLTFLVAIDKKEISWEEADALLQSDIIEFARLLKEDIIRSVMDAKIPGCDDEVEDREHDEDVSTDDGHGTVDTDDSD